MMQDLFYKLFAVALLTWWFGYMTDWGKGIIDAVVYNPVQSLLVVLAFYGVYSLVDRYEERKRVENWQRWRDRQ